ncbi:MAG: lipopolysaccharide biosynthesis [Pseudomonadota bacterium]
MNPELRYYISIFYRRLPLFVFVTLLITVPAVMIAFVLPPSYAAQALLLYERGQLDQNTAPRNSNFRPAEELQKVRQQLLTRQILIDIARDHDVFEAIGSMSPDQIVNSMRANTKIDNNVGRNSATFMRVRFEARSGAVAAAVANDYVTRIQDLSARSQRDRSGGTLAFFEQEVSRLNTELGLKSAQIVRYKNENQGALPDSLNFRLNEQSRLQERIRNLQRDVDELADRRSRMVLIFETSGSVETAQPEQRQTRAEAELARAEDALEELLIVLSPTNPRVVLQQSVVDRLRERVAVEVASASGQEAPATATDATVPDRNTVLFEAELAELDSRIENARSEIEAREARLLELEDSISRTPANTIALQALERERDTIERQYQTAEANMARAAQEERKIIGALSARFEVVENAIAPNSPFSPNRPMIAGAGLGGGIALGLGLILLLELMNRSIRRPVEITNAMGVSPLATIPYIMTASERLKRRLWTLAIVVVLCITVPAAMYYVHINVFPLDRLVDSVMDKITSLIPL